MKHSPSFNFITILKYIVRPDFLSLIQKEKPTGRIWGAWFFWNTFLAIIIAGLAFWGLSSGTKTLENQFWPEVPAFDFVFQDSQLVSTGLEEPFRLDMQDEEEEIEGAFIIDLEGLNYDENSLKVFDFGFLVNKDGFSIYEADKRKTQTILFNEFPELKNQSIDKQDAWNFIQKIKPAVLGTISVFIFAFAWFFYCIVRLIWIALMAFLFWIIGRLTRVKDLSYGNAFLMTLGISFFPALVGIVLLTFNFFHPLFSVLLYLLLFGLNIYDAPKGITKKS